MNTTVKCGISFVLGAATGSLVAWKLLNIAYERKLRAEIDDVKSKYCIKKPDDILEGVEVEAEEVPVEQEEEHVTRPYIPETILNMYRSTDDKKEGKDVKKPYVISVEEFDANEEYNKTTLNYYADGVLATEWDSIIKNADEIVGREFRAHFGKDEESPDSVYVRNDDLKCDYEILRDLQTYAEAMGEDYDPTDVED